MVSAAPPVVRADEPKRAEPVALRAYPPEVRLRGPDSVQQVVIDALTSSQEAYDLTDGVSLHEQRCRKWRRSIAPGRSWPGETGPLRSPPGVGALEAKVSGHRHGFRRRAADQLRQPDRPDLHQARLQRRRLPRQGERPERLPAQPARLRAGPRLRDPGEGRAGPPALPGRPRPEPAACSRRPPGCPTAAASGSSPSSSEYRLIRRWIAPGDAGRQGDRPDRRPDRDLPAAEDHAPRERRSSSSSPPTTPTARPRT